FRQVVPGGVAVVNADDPNAEILGAVNLDARRVAFAMEPASRQALGADVSARIVRLDGAGTRMVLRGFDREIAVGLHLGGPRAAACALAAAALAWALEIDRDAVVDGLERVPPVAGHLEAVDGGQDFDVRVDAAGTPDALAEALAAVRAVGAGRVHCVPGAAGGRRRRRTHPAGRGRRGGRRPRHPHRQQPSLRGPQPDPRPAPGRLPPAGQGPRRARPPAGHRGRAGRRLRRRLGADRRQGPPYLPDLRRSRRPLRRRRSRPRVAPPPRPAADVHPALGLKKKTRAGRPAGRATGKTRTKRAPRASVDDSGRGRTPAMAVRAETFGPASGQPSIECPETRARAETMRITARTAAPRE